MSGGLLEQYIVKDVGYVSRLLDLLKGSDHLVRYLPGVDDARSESMYYSL
jgi:hypothetical protein